MAPFIVSFSDPKGSTDNQFLQYLPVCKATFRILRITLKNLPLLKHLAKILIITQQVEK